MTTERPGEGLQRTLFGRSTSDAARTGLCVTCSKPVGAFKTPKAEREFRISGMCQECQDDVFGTPNA